MNHGFMIPFAEGSINNRLPGIVLARQLPLLDLDGQGIIYVVDGMNARIQKFQLLAPLGGIVCGVVCATICVNRAKPGSFSTNKKGRLPL